jgi:hypothetical protein
MKTSRHDEGRESGITRRGLIGSVAAIGAATTFVPRATMAALPGRGEFVVRNAHVLTMDPSLGDLDRGDVHVRNGEIIAVGRDVMASDAEVVDGRSMIALPGLIDTHMAPLGDPVTAIVRSAQPYNVDTVVIDGRILKRNGRLTAIDADEVTAQAAESLTGLKKRANWS